MKLDKELYRQTYERFRKLNEAELVERAYNAGKLSPQEAWRQYLMLAEFALKYCPPPGEWQRKQKLADLERYYANVRKLEAWRSPYGKQS
jgi:hypothetical protein